MGSKSDAILKFKFEPTPGSKAHFATQDEAADPLGPLSDLRGVWKGNGFNAIWRPVFGAGGQDRFLELNLTEDSINFDDVIGDVPNRGLLQPDIHMTGLTYFQQVMDKNTGLGLHVEPGIWAIAPATSQPAVDPTVIRMASIPHGTAILAQGTAAPVDGPLLIPKVNLLPFPIGAPSSTINNFAELDLTHPAQFRTKPDEMLGVIQGMVDDPNSVLRTAINGQEIKSALVLDVSTGPTPVPGGGTANTAFLLGDPPLVPPQNEPENPNAVAAQCKATFWIETVKGTPNFLQLQYSQTVLLNFNKLSWPHISVGTLRKVST